MSAFWDWKPWIQRHAGSMRASDKRLLKELGWSLAILCAMGTVAIVAIVAWGAYRFGEESKTEYYQRDRIPDTEEIGDLAAWGYPKPITRIFEAGSSSGFNGDGETLTIRCFPPDQAVVMKKKIWQPTGEVFRDWKPGLPENGEIREYIEKYAPAELKIPAHPVEDSFIQLADPPFRYYIIDLRKGISYDFLIRT